MISGFADVKIGHEDYRGIYGEEHSVSPNIYFSYQAKPESMADPNSQTQNYKHGLETSFYLIKWTSWDSVFND